MNETYELTWKRNAVTGNHLATDERDGITYTAWKDPGTRLPDRKWSLAAHSPASWSQARHGFSTLALAKAAALSTRCARCGRHRPFGTLEETGRNNYWTCRDREACDTALAARNAEDARITREIRNTDWAEASIRDTDDRPELIIRMESGNGYVIPATERDLLLLSYVLLTWLRTRYAEELFTITEAMKKARS